jgi:nitrous oxidase accessory protein NosD
LLENNSNGFYITSGVNNTAYLNNIVANTVQAYDAGTNNTWDYSGQGNYWSDNVNCTATYPPLSICSAPYVIDANSIDHYPYNHQV